MFTSIIKKDSVKFFPQRLLTHPSNSFHNFQINLSIYFKHFSQFSKKKNLGIYLYNHFFFKKKHISYCFLDLLKQSSHIYFFVNTLLGVQTNETNRIIFTTLIIIIYLLNSKKNNLLLLKILDLHYLFQNSESFRKVTVTIISQQITIAICKT